MSCPGKSIYDGEKAAKRAARSMMKRSGKKMIVYLCTECAGWHMTSRRPKDGFIPLKTK